jgi:hypothetical protein
MRNDFAGLHSHDGGPVETGTSNDSSLTSSQHSKTSKKSGKTLKCNKKNHALRKILRKLHLQKKQFKRIEKIFVAEKTDRTALEEEEAVDPYMLRPQFIQPGMDYMSMEMSEGHYEDHQQEIEYPLEPEHHSKVRTRHHDKQEIADGKDISKPKKQIGKHGKMKKATSLMMQLQNCPTSTKKSTPQ